MGWVGTKNTIPRTDQLISILWNRNQRKKQNHTLKCHWWDYVIRCYDNRLKYFHFIISLSEKKKKKLSLMKLGILFC